MQPTFMLDSGAYSAWSRGQAIDLDHYIAYIRANADNLDHYVALDVIPGGFGVRPTPRQVEVSAASSFENLLHMQTHGLDPIPVFHMHEDFKWLHKMIDHGCSYIGISPANDCTTAQKRMWLDRVFSAITDADGWPVIKTHAFGMTALPLLTRYPWYSADSVTWITFSGRGGVLVPHWDGKDWLFNDTPWACHVSELQEGTNASDMGNKISWRQNPTQRAHLEHWLAFAGSTLLKAETDYLERARLCCFFFQEFERRYVQRPFKRRHNSLVEDATQHGGKGLHLEHVRIFFTMNMARKYTRVLVQQEAKNRLLSFVYFQGDFGNLLDSYIYPQPQEELA